MHGRGGFPRAQEHRLHDPVEQHLQHLGARLRSLAQATSRFIAILSSWEDDKSVLGMDGEWL